MSETIALVVVVVVAVAVLIGICAIAKVWRTKTEHEDSELSDAGMPPSSSHDRRTRPSTTSMDAELLQQIAGVGSGQGGDGTAAAAAICELRLRRRRLGY